MEYRLIKRLAFFEMKYDSYCMCQMEYESCGMSHALDGLFSTYEPI